MKLYALTYGDIDDWDIYGIVDSLPLAEEWKARGDRNNYQEFELNKLPPVDWYRDNRMFPHAPDTSRMSLDTVRKICDYDEYRILEYILSGNMTVSLGTGTRVV